MNVVCCGTNKNNIEFLCNNPFLIIKEKRKDVKDIIYYFVDIDLDDFISWINSNTIEDITVFTTPKIWVNRKKVRLTIKYKFCYIHFFEITYLDIKNKIKTNFII